MSDDWVKDIGEFHATYGVQESTLASLPSQVVQQLRFELIKEEGKELRKAIQEQNVIAIADGCADLIVVTIGTARCYGIPMREVWDEVHRSNMSKLGEDGKPLYRDDGKVLKGPNFSPPDLEKVMYG